MFRIGSFARLAGVSAKQLRAYDEIGLFRPVWVDPSSAYRYYSPAQLPELRRILGLRQLGMPIDEIKRLAAGGDLVEALQRRRAELEAERRRVDERLAALDISVADDAAVDVVVRPVAAETVAIMTVGHDVGRAFHELESYVRDRRRRAHRPPGAFPETREIFVPITGPVGETDRIGVRRLPACRVASVIHRGDYAGVAPARQRLLQWVAAADLHPEGPMRTLYLQFGAEPELRLPPGWVVERDADFVTELQLPVG
ncbi:MAG TPA: MerR family transcriptional regulator [Candidatus Limnocylindria bacterium]|nr:MerR family transcriptional regulator [Candidatus Limnocylindria bacterium]